MDTKQQEILKAIELLIAKENDPATALSKVCALIADGLESYDWVGFYFMNHQTKKLHLGPYVGDPTDHTIIDFGKGICGQVALSGQSYLSADVQAESNYIACSINVRSEIVVPMYKGETLIGQIDIDSHQVNRFQAEDETFLKAVNSMIVEKLSKLDDYLSQLVQA